MQKYDDPTLRRLVEEDWRETRREFLGALQAEIRLLVSKERDEAVVTVSSPSRDEVHTCSSRDEGSQVYSRLWMQLHESQTQESRPAHEHVQ